MKLTKNIFFIVSEEESCLNKKDQDKTYKWLLSNWIKKEKVTNWVKLWKTKFNRKIR